MSRPSNVGTLARPAPPHPDIVKLLLLAARAAGDGIGAALASGAAALVTEVARDPAPLLGGLSGASHAVADHLGRASASMGGTAAALEGMARSDDNPICQGFWGGLAGAFHGVDGMFRAMTESFQGVGWALGEMAGGGDGGGDIGSGGDGGGGDNVDEDDGEGAEGAHVDPAAEMGNN